jgi:predicted amidohydrolase YtcJ
MQLGVVHIFNSSTQDAEAGGSLSSRPAWSTEQFQDSQNYTGETLSEKQTNKNLCKENMHSLEN